ncbi:MAG: NAD(P)H-dependent flavin oxidoreductase [Tuberibacillus sp.]
MNNSLCRVLGIKYPILQGGMGNVSDAGLAAAVSNAGGLGTIGVGNLSMDVVKRNIRTMLESSDYPCCVNIPISVHPHAKDVVEEVVKQGVPIVSLSAGNPAPFIPYLREHGVKVICVVASVRQARKAEAAGADVIVCEGYEAAGINAPNEATTITLVPQVVNAVSVPVAAAGGIGDGRGLAAAIALGASGVQMGTRFIATAEAPYHDNYKKAIIEADDESTVIVGRKFNRIRRLIRNEYVNELQRDEAELDAKSFTEKTSEQHHQLGAIEGDFKNGFINGGQIAGLIKDIPTVKELMETMVFEARERLVEAYKNLSF